MAVSIGRKVRRARALLFQLSRLCWWFLVAVFLLLVLDILVFYVLPESVTGCKTGSFKEFECASELLQYIMAFPILFFLSLMSVAILFEAGFSDADELWILALSVLSWTVFLLGIVVYPVLRVRRRLAAAPHEQERPDD